MAWLRSAAVLLCVTGLEVEAGGVRVRGYVKPSTGGYVAPSVRTKANSTKVDNYSTRGNVNPYTGKRGTR